MTSSTAPAAAGWRRALLATLVLSALLAAVVAAWAANFARGNVLPAMPLAGLIGPAKMSEHRFALAAALLPMPPAELGAIRSDLRRAPLATEPFLAAIRLEPDSARNQTRIERALARDPRSALVRVEALQRAIAREDLAEAVAMLAQINALNQELTLPMVKALTSSVRSPDQLGEIVATMGQHPSLMRGFVEGFLENSPPPELLRRLVRTAPDSVFAEPTLRQRAVAQLIQGDLVDEARALAGVRRESGAGLVSDPAFRNPQPRPPFGWQVIDSEVGASEFVSDGLAIEYFGRQSGPLLEQVTALARGRSYRARAIYRMSERSSGNLRLTVRCAADRRILTEQPLRPVRGEAQVTADFSAPATGCRGQVLGIEAQRDDSFGRDALTLRRLDIEAI